MQPNTESKTGARRAWWLGWRRKLLLRLRTVLRHPVLISSTTATLQAERDAVRRHLFNLGGVEPVAFEHESIQGRSPHEASVAYVDAAAVIVMILGGGHGSVGTETDGKSFTQLEVERAIAAKKPVLLYVRRPEGHTGTFNDLVDMEWERQALATFEARAFTTANELAAMVLGDVANTLRLYERVSFLKHVLVMTILLAIGVFAVQEELSRIVGEKTERAAVAAKEVVPAVDMKLVGIRNDFAPTVKLVHQLASERRHELAELRRCAESHERARRARWKFLGDFGFDVATTKSECAVGRRDPSKRARFEVKSLAKDGLHVTFAWEAVCEDDTPMTLRLETAETFLPCSTVLSAAWLKRLEGLAKRLRAAGPRELELVGYTDYKAKFGRACRRQNPKITNNAQLSLLRARAVAHQLEPDGLHAIAFGAGVHHDSAHCPPRGPAESVSDYQARCHDPYRRVDILVRKREFWSQLDCTQPAPEKTP